MNYKLLSPCVRRTLRFVAFAVLTVTSAVATYAQTGVITGRVQNAATGEYLRNATVSVVGTNISTTAGTGGFYTLADVPAGEARVAVSYTGLDTIEESIAVVSGQTVQKDFNLTTAAYGDDIVQLGELRVASTREGNAKAIMQQRVAINPVKVIAADAIGNVSEGNVGEFLKLMPGVVMDYVEADTRNVRLRGQLPKYSSVLLDGMPIANAASASIGTGRAFEFEQLSISSVEAVELTKVPTPDQPSSVAGTVNLRTRSAFDYAGRRIDWSVSLAANGDYLDIDETQGWDDEKHYKLLPNFSFDFSDVFLDGRLGITAGVQRSYTLARQRHVWLFYNPNDQNFTNNETETLTINQVWLQDGPKPTQRDTSYLRFDYKLTADLTTWLYLGYNDYDAKFYNRSLFFFPSAPAAGSTPTNQVVSGRVSINSNQYRNKRGNTAIFASGATFDKGDFRADLSLQYSRGRSNYETMTAGHFSDYASRLEGVSWRMTRSGPGTRDLSFTQLTGPDWRNLANYTFDADSVLYPERYAVDDILTGRIDFRHNLEIAGMATILKWGASTYTNSRTVHDATIRFGLPNTVGYPQNFRDTTYAPDWGFGGNAHGWPQLSPWMLYKAYVGNPGLFTTSAGQAATNLRQQLERNWDFDEDVHAAYLQSIFRFGQLEVSPGVRYEYTKSSGMGTRVLSNAQLTALGLNPSDTNNLAVVRAKYGSKLTDGNSYDAFLKYLTANYKFGNFVARASYHDAITRADLGNLVPGISAIDETGLIVTAANPDLKPERSQNINVSLEYYFEPVGLLSVTGFRSSIKDRQASNLTQLGAGGFNGDTTFANWRLNSVFNVGNTLEYSGVELDYLQQLSFLPGALSGFGLFANHTLLHYDDRAFYLGSPTWIANAGINYTHRKWSARLNGNWVGKKLDAPGRTYSIVTNQWSPGQNFAPEYTADRLMFDVNLEYRISSSLTVFLDGRNILNAETASYRGTEDNFQRVFTSGAIWMLGVKGKF